MKTKLQKNTKGFTIIEVLIVLAIAGLIILIVFLAVPALQRNSRNTQRANDVSRALGAAQEVLNNNNGDMSKLDSAALQTAMGALAYYESTKVTVSTSAPAGSPGTNNNSPETAELFKGATCEGGKAVPGTTRQLAMTFKVEKDVERCQTS